MIRVVTSGKYRLYSWKKNPETGRRRNLGTFATRAAAEKHERAVQYFKRNRFKIHRRSAKQLPVIPEAPAHLRMTAEPAGSRT